MGLYARYVVPRLTHLAMRQEQLQPYRERVTGATSGRVLEMGIGSGLNLPLYSHTVEEVIGIDTSPELLAFARDAAALVSHRFKVQLLQGSAARLPPAIFDPTIHSVLCTSALSTLPDP